MLSEDRRHSAWRCDAVDPPPLEQQGGMGGEHCAGEAGPGRQHLSEDRTVELCRGEAKVRHESGEGAHSIKHGPGWLDQDVGRAQQFADGRIVLGFTEQRSVGETGG